MVSTNLQFVQLKAVMINLELQLDDNVNNIPKQLKRIEYKYVQ